MTKPFIHVAWLYYNWYHLEGFVCFLDPYILVTSYHEGCWLVRVCTQGNIYSAAPIGNQAPGTMTRYRTQSPYPDTKQTGHCTLLIMLNATQGSNKHHFSKSLVWLAQNLNLQTFAPSNFDLLIWSPHLVQRGKPPLEITPGGACVLSFLPCNSFYRAGRRKGGREANDQTGKHTYIQTGGQAGKHTYIQS